MKPTLPKLLLTALLSVQALPAATLWSGYNQGKIDSDWDWVSTYELTGDLILNTTLSWPASDVDGYEEDNGIQYSDICWEGSGSSLSGTGKLTAPRADEQIGYGLMNLQSELYLYMPANAVIEKGVTLENMYLHLSPEASDSTTTINATLKNCNIRPNGNTVDLRKATLQECDYSFYASSGDSYSGTILTTTLELNTESRMEVEGACIVDGNVTMSGTLYNEVSIGGYYDENLSDEENSTANGWTPEQRVAISKATLMTPLIFNIWGYYYSGYDEGLQFSDYGQLTITGTLTVNRPTPVLFTADIQGQVQGDNPEATHQLYQQFIKSYTETDKILPNPQEALIICGSVSEQSVSNLKPYYNPVVYVDCDNSASGYEYESYQALTDKEFYAEAGTDGMVHLYLRDGSWDNTVTPEPLPTPTPTPTPTPEPTPTPQDALVWNDRTMGQISYDDEYGDEIVDERLNGNLLLNTTLRWTDAEVEDIIDIAWQTADGEPSETPLSLTGSGKLTVETAASDKTLGISNLPNSLYLCLPYAPTTIGEDITMENLHIVTSHKGATINGTLKNCSIEPDFEATVDLTRATLSGCRIYFYSDSSTVIAPELKLDRISAIEVEGEGNTIQGNVTMNTGTYATGEAYLKYDYSRTLQQNLSANGVSAEQVRTAIQSSFAGGIVFTIDSYMADGSIHYDYDNWKPQLTITGTLNVEGPSAIIFSTLCDGEVEDGSMSAEEFRNTVAAVTQQLPSADSPVIVCGSVTEKSVNNLRPYSSKSVIVEVWNDDEEYDWEYESFRALTDKAFYAEAGKDGLVYIYLRDGSWENSVVIPTPTPTPTPTPKPEIPELVITPGSSITLGGENTTPSASHPVQMQGGTVDATALNDSLLNNSIFKGNSGTVKLNAQQTFSVSGSGTLGYNIDGGNLALAKDSNVTLGGETYATGNTTVGNGILTVSTNATLGKGANSRVDLTTAGGRLTNYGRVNANIDMGNDTTMLNEGIIAGAVLMEKGSTAINNGSISGKLTVKNGARAFGSGIFSDTLVESGGFLHAGNSPGFQSHKALTLQSGATISFSVDGIRPATAEQAGGGTHSQMQVESLTLSGTVNVAVDITTGIVNAGAEPFSVDLMTATQTDGDADFALQLDDDMGLLEDAALSWSGSTLTLSGSVSEDALAMLANKDSVHLANTMWASAAVVQDFARLAESQSMIGNAEQTTWWGGAFGTFQHVSDDTKGYTYNSSGYGVGLQHAFSDSFRAGFGLGQSFGTYSARRNGTEVDQMAIMPILTAQYVSMQGQNSFSLNAHLAYGNVENEAETINLGMPGTAEWDDTVISGGLRAAWNVKMSDTLTVSPFIGLTYRHVAQDDFTEKYTGGARRYSNGSLQEWSLPLGVTIRSVHGFADGSILAPELTLAYVADISRNNPSMRCTNGRFNSTIEGYTPNRSSFMMNAGVNWVIDLNWSFGAFYNLEITGDQTDQSINGSVRYSF